MAGVPGVQSRIPGACPGRVGDHAEEARMIVGKAGVPKLSCAHDPCPVCGHKVPVTKDRTLLEHRVIPWDSRTPRCEGSGKPR